MVVVGREVPLGGKGWGGKSRHGARPPGLPSRDRPTPRSRPRRSRGPELDEQDEGSTETDDGAGGNVEDLDRDKSSCGVVHKLRCSPT
jgi:hypothetical protein